MWKLQYQETVQYEHRISLNLVILIIDSVHL